MILPITAFFLVSTFVGIHASRRIQGKARNFFVAGNILPSWVLVISMTGQAIELGGTQDNASRTMTDGFWSGAILPIGIGLSLIFIGLFFAKPLHAMKLLTLPDYYARRFDFRSGAIVSVLCVISFIILSAGNLAAIGLILSATIGVPLAWGVAGVGTIIAIYTMAGGLFGVTWNDILQIGVTIVALVVLCLYCFTTPETGITFATIQEKFSWEPLTHQSHGALSNWAALLALAFGDIVALDFMERVFAAKTARSAQYSCIIAGFTTIAIGAGVALVGLAASVLLFDPANGDPFLQFVQKDLPPGISMLVLMGLIGAGVSTIDGAILACSVVLTRNIAQPIFPTLMPRTRLVTASRLAAIPVTLSAVVLAIIRPVPGDLLILAFDMVFAGCLVPLTLGLYWKRGTAAAAFWSIVIPSVIRILLHFGVEELPPEWNGLQTLIPPILSLLIFVGVTLLSPQATKAPLSADSHG